MAKAEYGDIIYTKYNLYRHYGIYINENCVVHCDGKLDDMFLRKMFIRETTMDRFLGGKTCYYIDNMLWHCLSNLFSHFDHSQKRPY